MSDTLTKPPARTFALCANGHELTFGNVSFRKNGKRNSTYAYCVTCKKQQQKEYNDRKGKDRNKPNPNRKWVNRGARQLTNIAASKWLLEDNDALRDSTLAVYVSRIARARIRAKPAKEWNVAREEARARDDVMETIERMSKDDSKKPWRLLQIKPDALDAWDKFDAALQEARNSGEGLPNCEGRPEDFVDYDEDDLPTARQAAMLCAECPLFDLCDAYRLAANPTWGIHAGVRYEPIPGKPYDGQVVMD